MTKVSNVMNWVPAVIFFLGLGGGRGIGAALAAPISRGGGGVRVRVPGRDLGLHRLLML